MTQSVANVKHEQNEHNPYLQLRCNRFIRCKLLCGVCKIFKPERDNIHNRHMSGPGYRKRYIKVIEQGVGGIIHQLTKPSRCGTEGKAQEDSRALGCRMHLLWSMSTGQPHPFTGSGAPPGRQALQVRFSGVVSTEPLAEIGRKGTPHRVAKFKDSKTK